jgi:hypothetical protein
MTLATAAAALTSSVFDAVFAAAAGNNSPWTTLIMAILIGSAVHLIVSLLVTLKNVGMHVYLVIQLAGVWFLFPHAMRLEMWEQAKTQTTLLCSGVSLAIDTLARLTSNSTAHTTL